MNARTLSIFTLTILASGCQTLPWNWGEETSKHINSSLTEIERQSLRPTELPAAVRDALLPGVKVGPSPDFIKGQQRFDLAVKNAPARDVFLSLVSGTTTSVVLEPNIRGTMTLQLKNVTVDEAFDAIKSAYGYPYKKVKNRYYVYGKGFRSKIFRVNYLNLVRNGISSTNVKAGELTASSSGGGSATALTPNATGGGASPAGTAIGVRTTSVNDFWKSLKDSLEGLIGNENGRKVVVNPDSNIVVVRATADELAVVEEFLNTTHESATQQVILEAKIMEVELKDGFQAGINWADLMGSSSAGLSVSQIGGGKVFSSGTTDIVGNSTTNLATNAISNAQTSAFGGIFSLAINGANFGAFLEMMQTQGDVHVLSSPRVSTVNSQKAIIKVGGEEFYVTNISQTSTVSASGTSDQPATSIQLTPFFSGISLDVTPQIEEDDHITLHLHSSVSEVGQSNKSIIIGSKNYDLPLAASTTRESDSIVRARSGQIIVVGGLMKETTNDEEAKVPFLGSLPIIGNLFKHKKVARVKKELVMLIKPTIIDSNQYWAQDVGNALERFDTLRR